MFDRVGLWWIRIVDLVQDRVLANYSFFSFLVRRAPQKHGARACWLRAGNEFLLAYKKVPAYRKFLEANDWSCQSNDIQEIFSTLPVMDKNNYVLAYTTEERCLDGSFFEKGVVIDESSGSTGTPFNWVRGARERETVKDVIGVYLRYCFGAEKYIVLNTFSMGAWATGFNMALAAQSLGVVKSTGPDIDKIFKTMQFFGSRYPYILNGYPPFLKHLIDEGEKRGFRWRDYTVHILVGGEGMSEGLRDYLLKHVKTVFSGYGASDLEIGMAGENPLTVMIRKLCRNDRSLCQTLFGEDQRLPMLFQYNPLDHFIEIIGKEIVVTISKPWTLSPRIRYNIKDEGGMIVFDDMHARLKRHNIDLSELEKACRYPRWYLPFLYVFGRKDSTVSVMGANIYPEDVESIIFSDMLLAKNIHSFLISLVDDVEGNPRPCFEFELSSMEMGEQVRSVLEKLLCPGLARLSQDYRKARQEYSQAVTPIIRIFGMHEGPFQGDQERIKRRYIKR
jgi:phenylacetate-CoA ligase